MLGAIIGDIVGSVYEFDNHRHKNFEPLFSPSAFITDDTVCTIAVADALTKGTDPATTLKYWCARYKFIEGWGNRFFDWIEAEVSAPYGSYGNGAAMRISPAGLLARSLEEAIELSNRMTEITHNHPEGMRGAAATASAIYWAKTGVPAHEIRHLVSDVYGYYLSRTVDDIRPTYVFNESCMETVPEALTCALEATSYEDALRNAISIGGDSDTVAAIAGGLAEALYGLPTAIADQGWGYVPSDMRQVIQRLYERSGHPFPVSESLLRVDLIGFDKHKHCAIINYRNLDCEDE
jgi:ADP-ribosyl-[dinitrogen reductase] hydrolase